MTTRPTVGWCHPALELIGMSILALWMKQDSLGCLSSVWLCVDVIIFIWVVDSQVFVKGIVFSSVLYCVSVLQSATVARIPRLPQGPSRGGEVNNQHQWRSHSCEKRRCEWTGVQRSGGEALLASPPGKLHKFFQQRN